MKYVLDASVALKWALLEADSDKANRIREDFGKGHHELIAPDIFPVEIGHVLSKVERRGMVQLGEGGVLLADILTTLPKLRASLPLLAQAYAISSQKRISMYDCLYVALAEVEQCELITADSRLLNALKGYPIVQLSAFPF